MEPQSSARAWLVYDMGSSAYALSVGTLFYPIFFARYAGGGTASSGHWAIAILLSSLVVGITAPGLGAWADARGRRNAVLAAATLVSAAGVLLLPLTARLPLAAAIALFLVIHICFSIATNFYDSYVSLYGREDANYTPRSGTGWALGYLGGLVCLGLILAGLRGRMPERPGDYWIVFGITAVFYLAFSAYVIARLPADVPRPSAGRNSVRESLRTLRRWREHRTFFLFVLASILVTDGITTVLFFTSTYANDQLRYTLAETTLLFAIVQGVAVVATWLATRPWLPVRDSTLLIASCAVWVLVGVGLVIGPEAGGMIAVAVLTGLVVGSTPALMRGIMGRLVPPERRAELFGFAALAGRLGAILGPLLFLAGLRLGGLPAAMGTTIPAFLLGALIFARLAPTVEATEPPRAAFSKQSELTV